MSYQYFVLFCFIIAILMGMMEKAMAPHSSTLAWKIPWMEEPGRLQFMGSLSRMWLNDFTFTFHFHALEKEMANHSSVLAWRIPGTGEPGGLPSYGVAQSWTRLKWLSSSSIHLNTLFQPMVSVNIIEIFYILFCTVPEIQFGFT